MSNDDRNISILRAYRVGTAVDAIARKHGISARMVRTVVQKAGVPRRHVGHPRKPEPVAVPAWVPAALVSTYVGEAEREGEEAAASMCRRLKRAIAA